MTDKKHLIVNADDFGQSLSVNRGIVEAHERGIVTSASLMVRWPAAAEAASYGRNRRGFSLGLHIDLGEWVYRNGDWIALYHVVPLDDIAQLKEEVSRQLAAFRRLVGHDPSHLDSHQHVHLKEPVRSVVLEVAQELKIPVRNCSAEVRHCGRFYGQEANGRPYPEGITVEALIEILATLEPGITELGCHPGTGDDLDMTYGRERAQEVEALCNTRVQSALVEMGIDLCSFNAMPVASTAAHMEPAET